MLKRPGDRRALIPYLLFVAALLLTVSGAKYASNTAAVEDRLRFQMAATEIRSQVLNRIDSYVAMLLGAAGLFAASDTVEPDEFRDYVARLDLRRRYPGVQGLGFSRRTAPASPSSTERHPIVYLEPMDERNALAVGYDMWSESERRAAMERARDTGEPAATGKVTLIQERLDPVRRQAGFLIYVPVYLGGSVPNSVKERRDRLSGFVYCPFRGDDLLGGILENSAYANLALEAYDGRVDENRLLHRSMSGIEGLSAIESINVAGRPWTLVLRGGTAFSGTGNRAFRTLVVAAGVFLSVLLFVVTRAQVQARATAERTAEDLRRSEEKLRQADQAKDEFLATMSHELRTPLNAIMGWIFMLRKGQVSPAAQTHALDVIARNAAAQATLIEDLLDVSRAVAGRLPLNKTDVDLGAVLTVAVDSMEPAARKQKLAIVCRVPPHLGSVNADPDRLQQIVLNLLSNAVKFTPEGGEVVLAAAGDAEAATFRVSDTGAGIAADQLPFVFERFWQADRSTTRNHSGVGLGLTISRHLVELHGGTIEATSAGEGRGMTITVRLPRRL
jgi:signal transduction histidine kinase